MIEGMDFICLPTQDMPRAIAFYRDTLGLPTGLTWEDSWVEFDLGGATLGLLNTAAVEMPFEAMAGGGIGLRVDNVKARLDELIAKGVRPAMPFMDSGVCHMAGILDPDGNHLMLHHRYAPEE